MGTSYRFARRQTAKRRQGGKVGQPSDAGVLVFELPEGFRGGGNLSGMQCLDRPADREQVIADITVHPAGPGAR